MTQTFTSFFSLSLLLVVLAATLDVLANLLLAKSGGFCLSLAVRHMDLAVAYAMWGSVGILGTSLGGWLFFSQKLRPCAFAGMALLMTGMALLHMS